jgi:hypothetical protein
MTVPFSRAAGHRYGWPIRRSSSSKLPQQTLQGLENARKQKRGAPFVLQCVAERLFLQKLQDSSGGRVMQVASIARFAPV